MRALLLALALTFVRALALGQGKISFQNDSLHLVCYDPGFGPLNAVAIDSAHMPPGTIILVADLYAGTSSSAMSLVSTTTFSSTPGRWSAASVTVPGIAGGSSAFVVVQVRDQSIAPPTTFTGIPFGDGYYGRTEIFTFTLGSGVTYPVLSGANGTWAPGTYPLDQYGAGSKAAIVLTIPEPCGYVMAGLGIAAVMIFRRRK